MEKKAIDYKNNRTCQRQKWGVGSDSKGSLLNRAGSRHHMQPIRQEKDPKPGTALWQEAQ